MGSEHDYHFPFWSLVVGGEYLHVNFSVCTKRAFAMDTDCQAVLQSLDYHTNAGSRMGASEKLGGPVLGLRTF